MSELNQENRKIQNTEIENTNHKKGGLGNGRSVNWVVSRKYNIRKYKTHKLKIQTTKI